MCSLSPRACSFVSPDLIRGLAQRDGTTRVVAASCHGHYEEEETAVKRMQGVGGSKATTIAGIVLLVGREEATCHKSGSSCRKSESSVTQPAAALIGAKGEKKQTAASASKAETHRRANKSAATKHTLSLFLACSSHYGNASLCAVSTSHIPNRFRRLPRCAAFGGSARNDGSCAQAVSARNDGRRASAIAPKTAHVSARLPRYAPIGRCARNDGSIYALVSCCVICPSYQYGASAAGDKRRAHSGRSDTVIRNDGRVVSNA